MWLEKPFSRGQAWMDMLLLANHKAGHVRKRGVRTTVERGQLGWSMLALSDRWGWSRGKVQRFLDELEANKQIIQQKKRITTLITILNYDLYQSANTTDDTTDAQQTDINKNDKNDKEEKKNIRGEIFTPPSLEEVRAYCLERNRGIDPEKWYDHYTSNGWKVGKNKMKDWKAAVRTWEKNEIGKENGNNGKNGGKVGFAAAGEAGKRNWLD
ncbi:MAG: hypothetical protein SCH71_16975 [Desulfobulbaceae bacterium]|nr:hypothetical protein [Desulfobulbaceae bacterium]